MSSPRTRLWSSFAALVVLVVGLTGLAGPAQALTPRTVTLQAAPAQAFAGSTAVLSGTVTKSPRGSVVTLQRRAGTVWVGAGRTTTNASGKFTLRVTLPASAGRVVYRAHVPATARLAARYSPFAAVTALRRTTASLQVSDSPIAAGAASTLSGTVSPYVSGDRVSVQRRDGGTWVLVGRAVLDASGGYELAVSPAATSVYRTVVAQRGLNAAAVSPQRTVVVVGPGTGPSTTPQITTDAVLPDGHRLGSYAVTFTKLGGPGFWSALQVPAGFSLDPVTGTLTGKPTVAGLYHVRISFTEASGRSAVKSFSLTVLQPKITTTAIPEAVTGTPYSTQLAKTGLDGTWEAAGFLPDPFTLSSSGLISGTATETGDFFFQVIFTETSTGATSRQGFLLHVAAPGSPTITTKTLPGAIAGKPYAATLAATPTGGTWSVTQSSLPVGLSLNPTTGAITGTPTVAGEKAQFVVTYTKGETQNTQVLTLAVTAPAPAAG